MTDQFPQKDTIEDELAQLARQVPAIPSDYADLRRLLALLPTPWPSENPNPDVGNPALNSVGASQPSQSSSPLLGPPPGSTPSAAIATQGVITHGWQPTATMLGFGATDTLTTAHSLPANGGCLTIPVEITAPMMLERVSIWNTDTASARAWTWGLYEQTLSVTASKTLNQVAAGIAPDSFTASVASKRTVPYFSVSTTTLTGATSPYEIAYSPDSAYAYVTDYQGGGKLRVFRTSDNALIKTIDLGGNAGNKMVVSADGKTLYVAQWSYYGSVIVIDTTTLTVTMTIPGIAVSTGGISGLALVNGGAHLYAMRGGGTNPTIYVIQTSDHTVVATIAEDAYQFYPSSDGTFMWITSPSGTTAKRVNCTTHAVVATINGLSTPRSGVTLPNGTYTYIGSGGYSCYVIRNSDNTLLTTLTMAGRNPYYDVLASPDSAYVWYPSPIDGEMYVIRTSDNTVVQTFHEGTLGNSPGYMDMTPDGNFVYIAANDSRLVTIIRTSDYAIVETVPVGNSPKGVYISPNGLKFYVLMNYATVYMMAINPVFATMVSPGVYWLMIYNVHATNTLGVGSAASGPLSYARGQTKTIRVPHVTAMISTPTHRYSEGVLALPNGTRVYSMSDNDGTVVTIDSDTGSGTLNTVLATTSIGASYNWGGMVMTPDGAYLYIWDRTEPGIGIKKFRTSDNTVVSTIPNTGGMHNLNAIAINAAGTYAYVASYGVSGIGGAISVLRLSDDAILGTTELAYNYPSKIAVTPDGNWVYVADYSAAKISKFDPVNYDVEAEITVASKSVWLVATNDYLYSISYSQAHFDVISTATNAIVATVELGYAPDNFILSPDGTKAYVMLVTGPTIAQISLSTYQITGSCLYGGGNGRLAITPDGTLLYATSPDTDSMTVIRTSDFTVVETVKAPKQYTYPLYCVIPSTGAFIYSTTDGGLHELFCASVGDMTQVDFVAATWTKQTGVYAAVMEGRVFGQTSAF